MIQQIAIFFILNVMFLTLVLDLLLVESEILVCS